LYREKDFVCHPDVGKHHLQSLVEAVHESDNQTRHLVSVGHFYLNKVPSHREAQVPVFDGSTHVESVSTNKSFSLCAPPLLLPPLQFALFQNKSFRRHTL